MWSRGLRRVAGRLPRLGSSPVLKPRLWVQGVHLAFAPLFAMASTSSSDARLELLANLMAIAENAFQVHCRDDADFGPSQGFFDALKALSESAQQRTIQYADAEALFRWNPLNEGYERMRDECLLAMSAKWSEFEPAWLDFMKDFGTRKLRASAVAMLVEITEYNNQVNPEIQPQDDLAALDDVWPLSAEMSPVFDPHSAAPAALQGSLAPEDVLVTGASRAQDPVTPQVLTTQSAAMAMPTLVIPPLPQSGSPQFTAAPAFSRKVIPGKRLVPHSDDGSEDAAGLCADLAEHRASGQVAARRRLGYSEKSFDSLVPSPEEKSSPEGLRDDFDDSSSEDDVVLISG